MDNNLLTLLAIGALGYVLFQRGILKFPSKASPPAAPPVVPPPVHVAGLPFAGPVVPLTQPAALPSSVSVGPDHETVISIPPHTIRISPQNPKP